MIDAAGMRWLALAVALSCPLVAHAQVKSTTLGDDSAIAFVPYLAHDVYDFAALHEVGTLLFA